MIVIRYDVELIYLEACKVKTCSDLLLLVPIVLPPYDHAHVTPMLTKGIKWRVVENVAVKNNLWETVRRRDMKMGRCRAGIAAIWVEIPGEKGRTDGCKTGLEIAVLFKILSEGLSEEIKRRGSLRCILLGNLAVQQTVFQTPDFTVNPKLETVNVNLCHNRTCSLFH